MTATKTWNVQLVLDEDGDTTRARAFLGMRNEAHLTGEGRARRNPADPAVPEIGDELAASRALSDLAHQLLDVTINDIQEITHQRVTLTH